MKPKLLLCLALVVSGVLSGCSVVAKYESASADKFHWGEVVGGFQMATWLDESNGIVHCRIRNATTNEMDYPSFDFGYFEFVSLEIRGATDWTNLQVAVFPQAGGYSSAVPYLLKRIQPGQIVPTRGRFQPWPVLKHEEYLKWYPGDTNQAALAESLNRRYAVREELVTKLCGEDTFALDLIWDKALADLPEGQTVAARVSQKFRTSTETMTLLSPVFRLNSSPIPAFVK